MRRLRRRSRPRLDALLVTEPGGHLLEMWAMRDVAAAERRAWCTIDSPDVRSLLRDERVMLGAGPTCRNLPNLLRNMRVALRIVPRHRPRVILCTGSGIVVPFALVGRLHGARVLYVECGGRVNGPSLSCRIVSRVTHRTYVQWPELVEHVRDGEFHGRLPWERAVDAPPAGEGTHGTVFTVGTSRMFPFDRLVRSSEAVGQPGRVLVQRGASTVRPDGAEVVDWLSFDALREEIGAAGAVVTHGGIGSVLLAVMLGHRPVVMPRRPELGESVDDHQVEFARRLEQEGLVTVADGPADVARALREVRRGRDGAQPACRPNPLLHRLQQDMAEALA